MLTMIASLYTPGQFMNPGPAPRPPTDRPRLNLTPSVSTLPASVSALSLQSPASSSTPSLQLTRSQTEKVGGGAYAVAKDGPAKVKEEGGLLRGLVWNDRWLVLREYQLDFLKSNTSPKVAFTIQLRDVTNITRSETYPYSFEITRTLNPQIGGSPPRDGPTRVTVCKVDTDDEVYAWIDAIYERCPSMGGVSNPTNFTHRVHVGYDPHTGGFVGLPAEWEKLLTASAITKEDYQKNPEAIVEVLSFYTEKLMKRADDPAAYPSLTPTPPIEANNRQLGYPSTGSSIAPPRQTPSAFQRQDSFQSNRSDSYSPVNDQAQRAQVEREARESQARADAERQRRMDEEIRRKREQQQREQDRQREREEQAAYNASLPKTRPPMAQQELGGYGDDPQPRPQPDRYNPSRPAPGTPTGQRPTQSSSQQQPQSLRPNLQAQRPAPSAPTNGQPGQRSVQQTSAKPAVNGTRQPQPSAKYTNGGPVARPANGAQPPSRIPAATPPKPLNVQTKQPTGASAQSDAVKKAEQALTRKDDGGGRKEVRMSSMSEAEVMAKLREVVSKERPLDSYNKQKKIGQGASGSVYVARIRENATSAMARKILREQGPKAQVAIKQMDLRNQPRKELIVNEIIVMKESRHENIVNFLDAFLQEENSELWVVMEFMEGGALTDVIDNNPEIREDQIATVCLEVSVYWIPLHENEQVLTFHRLARASRICMLRTLFTATSSPIMFYLTHAATSRSVSVV
jgi:hypothetical protein